MAATLTDCASLVTAAQEAGGRAPKPLANILAGAHLLNTYSAPVDPARAIVAAAVAGRLDEKRLDAMLSDYGSAMATAKSRGELRQRSEQLFVAAFQQALRDGACDELLDSVRPHFEAAAAKIDEAKVLLPSAETDVEQFLATAQPQAVRAWQTLQSHVDVVEAISRIAALFGCRPAATFSLVEPYPLGDGFRINDQALWCGGGSLIADSAAFNGVIDRGHRASPWLKIPLRLHTLETATMRYRAWAATEFDRIHSGPQESIFADGQLYPVPRPENPFRQKVST